VSLIATYWIVDRENYLNVNIAPQFIKKSILPDLEICLPILELNTSLVENLKLLDNYKNLVFK